MKQMRASAPSTANADKAARAAKKRVNAFAKKVAKKI